MDDYDLVDLPVRAPSPSAAPIVTPRPKYLVSSLTWAAAVEVAKSGLDLPSLSEASILFGFSRAEREAA